MTTYCLMAWMHSGSHQKSETEVSCLVKDVIWAEDFNPSDLDGFTVKRSLHALDNGGKETVTFPNDWLKMDITLDIPTKLKDNQSTAFIIPGFHYQPLVGIIRLAFADIQANAFHLLPFKRLWRDPLSDGHQECVFKELYTSDSWLQAQDDLHRQPKEHGCSLEHIIAGLMFFSNMTHLATFRTAKSMAPLSHPNLLPDHVKDILSLLPQISKSGITALHTHCRQDLFHACWKHLLDAEFLEAYRHGIGLIVAIKDMGSCLCPCCLMPKAMFDLLGLVKDIARGFIYESGNTVDGSKVQATLGEGSWVPTLNLFVEKLGPLGFDAFCMLAVDFMHECELGTWKALFTHLICLLHAIPGGDCLVATLDNRSVFLAKLSMFAQWHALTKLRMHSKNTFAFTTMELPKERAAREHKAAHQRLASDIPDVESGGRRTKKFNMNTYKFHAMGDYLQAIQLFGMIDSFTSQIGDKLDTPAQLTKHKHCRRVLCLYTSKQMLVDLPKLKNHLLYCLRKLDITHCDHMFTNEECNSVIISDNRLYVVQTMQVHYTTYNLRREYDTINSWTHCDVMVLSGETNPRHLYWYACVLGIYYLDVMLNNDGKSFTHQDDESDDWEAYYVGMDMFMRYTPYGIGHPTILREMTRDCTNADLADSPQSDVNEVQLCEGDSKKGGSDDEGGPGGEEEDEDDDDTDEEEYNDDPDNEGMADGEDSIDKEDSVDKEDDHVFF
ncbi:hypothetical protein BDR06DRAFT_972033 [Suillus hirtellus]|nr:hypothetical protein BDR06DRAFT_972033 [Suillus hirtellus]